VTFREDDWNSRNRRRRVGGHERQLQCQAEDDCQGEMGGIHGESKRLAAHTQRHGFPFLCKNSNDRFMGSRLTRLGSWRMESARAQLFSKFPHDPRDHYEPFSRAGIGARQHNVAASEIPKP
jgi:hypothetical protein